LLRGQHLPTALPIWMSPKQGTSAPTCSCGTFQSNCTCGYSADIPAGDSGPLHLHLGHHIRQDPPSEGDGTSEGAFLVNVGAFDSLFGHLKAQTDVLVLSSNKTGIPLPVFPRKTLFLF
jgi:hypothetical protein